MLRPENDASDNLSFAPNKKYTFVLVSDPAFASGEKYELCVGGNICVSLGGSFVEYTGTDMFTHFKDIYVILPPIV
jgi:hypothetical protein